MHNSTKTDMSFATCVFPSDWVRNKLDNETVKLNVKKLHFVFVDQPITKSNVSKEIMNDRRKASTNGKNE